MATQKTKMHFGIDPRTREIVIGSFRMKLPESRWLRTLIGVLLICGGILGFLLFLFGGIVGEEVELNSTVVFLWGVRFRQDMICNNVHTADE